MGRPLSPYEKRTVNTALERVGVGARGRIECPLCVATRGRADLKKSLYLHPDGGWVCFRCGVTGWLPGSGSAGGSRCVFVDLPEHAGGPELWQQPPEGYRPLYENEYTEDLDVFREYLDVRGLDPLVARAMGLGGVTTGRHRGYVIAPVRDPDGSWKGWVGRYAGVPPENLPTYRYPPGMPWHTYLYRQEILSVPTALPALVVEGFLDALHLFPNAVATLGKMSPRQIQLLLNSRRPVVLVPDGDAWERAEAQLPGLRAMGLEAGVLLLPPRMDPDEFPPGAVEAAAYESLKLDYALPLAA